MRNNTEARINELNLLNKSLHEEIKKAKAEPWKLNEYGMRNVISIVHHRR